MEETGRPFLPFHLLCAHCHSGTVLLEDDERLHAVVELHDDAFGTHVGMVGDELLQCGVEQGEKLVVGFVPGAGVKGGTVGQAAQGGVEQGEDGLADVITHLLQGIRALLGCLRV